MADFIRITDRDNVAVALRAIEKGTAFTEGGKTVTAIEDIPQGHKMALRPISAGELIIKYGVPIGHATEDIAEGAHVHTNNVKTNLSGEVKYTYHPKVTDLAGKQAPTFMGYVRPDGRVGIRNEIWIIPVVGCVNDIAGKLAADNQDLVSGSVEGIYSFHHPYGCSQTGKDLETTGKILTGLVRHPNAGGVLVLSLGCENLTHEKFLASLGDYDPNRVKFITCQDEEDEFAAGRRALEELAAYAGKFKRQEVSADKLVIGLKCGGSDGLSGLTANPTVGRVCDTLCSMGGTAILTEVPEMFGAEDLLLSRCRNEKVFDDACNMLNGFKDYFINHHEVVYDNPSPGNKAGGITTLEDKSCGCVQKGGSAPIEAVLGYGESATVHGLNLLTGPGNDLVSTTALTAAGADLILFTTGRGTPFGAPVPTVKISSNTPLYEKKKNWIDFNAGVATQGVSLDQTGEDLFSLILKVAGGEKTKQEEIGARDIAIFKDGVTL